MSMSVQLKWKVISVRFLSSRYKHNKPFSSQGEIPRDDREPAKAVIFLFLVKMKISEAAL